MKLAPAVVAVVLVLAACSRQDTDLKQELAELARDLRGKVDPLPALRPQELFKFEGGERPDPFQPWTMPEKLDTAARRDRMLLARYASAEDIEKARLRALGTVQSTISEGEIRLEQAKGRVAELAREQAERKGGSKPSAQSSRDLAGAQARLKEAEAFVAAKRDEMAAIDALYGEDRKRHAELTARRK